MAESNLGFGQFLEEKKWIKLLSFSLTKKSKRPNTLSFFIVKPIEKKKQKKLKFPNRLLKIR